MQKRKINKKEFKSVFKHNIKEKIDLVSWTTESQTSNLRLFGKCLKTKSEKLIIKWTS